MSPHFTTANSKRVRQAWERWFTWHNLPERHCSYCGCVLSCSCDQTAKTMATRDHTLPQSRGGTKWIWSCQGCNGDKGSLTLNEYRVVLMMRQHRIVIFPFEWKTLQAWLVSWYNVFIPKKENLNGNEAVV